MEAPASAIGSEKIKAVAPDMYGYGKTDKPEGVENYKISILTQDILGLIRGALVKKKL